VLSCLRRRQNTGPLVTRAGKRLAIVSVPVKCPAVHGGAHGIHAHLRKIISGDEAESLVSCIFNIRTMETTILDCIFSEYY
jgi:hypothetical protein